MPIKHTNSVSVYNQFWKWFLEHEAELYMFESGDREEVFDRLSIQLQRVDPNLTFEFGPKREGKREFVISAGGIRQAFPSVSKLVAAAPHLERWNVIAFRPRRPVLNIIEFGGIRVHPHDVRFSLLHNGEVAGIHLFIPGYQDDDAALKQVGYLMLDEALGEHDVETKVGLIEMFPADTESNEPTYPISELAKRFDDLMGELKNSGGS